MNGALRARINQAQKGKSSIAKNLRKKTKVLRTKNKVA